MLEVYGDNQIQASPKTIGFCLYRLFIPSGYNKDPVTKTNSISQPILNANSDIASVMKNHSEAITINEDANSEPQVQELAETDDRTSGTYDISIDHSVIWTKKMGLMRTSRLCVQAHGRLLIHMTFISRKWSTKTKQQHGA